MDWILFCLLLDWIWDCELDHVLYGCCELGFVLSGFGFIGTTSHYVGNYQYPGWDYLGRSGPYGYLPALHYGHMIGQYLPKPPDISLDQKLRTRTSILLPLKG